MTTGNFLSAGVAAGTVSPLTVPVFDVPESALIIAYTAEAHASGSPPAFDHMPGFSSSDTAADFDIDADSKVRFFHKRYQGESDFLLSWAGGTPTAVGLLIAVFAAKKMHVHDFLANRSGPNPAGGTGRLPEAYGLAMWYYGGDSSSDVTRADDSLDTLFGTDFGGTFSAIVLQEFSLGSTTVPGLTPDGTAAGAQTRLSLTTWGDLGADTPLDEWGWGP